MLAFSIPPIKNSDTFMRTNWRSNRDLCNYYAVLNYEKERMKVMSSW